MFRRWLLPLSIALAIGFLIGRISIRPENGESSTASDPTSTRLAALSKNDPTPKPKRSHERINTAGTEESDRVIVRLEDIKSIVSGSRKIRESYEDFSHRLDPVLAVLGLSASESESVRSIFKQNRERIFAIESRSAVLKSANDSAVVLDLAAATAPIRDAIQASRDEFWKALGSKKAEILDAAISWDQYYRPPPRNEMTLRVDREGDGLFIVQSTGLYERKYRLKDSMFPPESQSISAEQAFKAEANMADAPDRWSHLLRGLNLKPKDVKDDAEG